MAWLSSPRPSTACGPFRCVRNDLARKEISAAHQRLDRAKRVLDGAAADSHAAGSRPRCFGNREGKTRSLQSKLFDDEIDDAEEAVLINPVVPPFRTKHRPAAVSALTETHNSRLHLTRRSLPQRAVSTQHRLVAHPQAPSALPRLAHQKAIEGTTSH